MNNQIFNIEHIKHMANGIHLSFDKEIKLKIFIDDNKFYEIIINKFIVYTEFFDYCQNDGCMIVEIFHENYINNPNISDKEKQYIKTNFIKTFIKIINVKFKLSFSPHLEFDTNEIYDNDTMITRLKVVKKHEYH